MQQQNNNLKNLLNVSPLGDTFVYDEGTDSILYRFSGKRKVMSTSIWNGGYQEDLAMVFNHTCNADECYMLAPTYEEHMRIIIKRMELDELQVCGMLTAAKMKHVAFEIAEYQALTVTAVVTAGVELNAGRVGDPTPHYDPIQRPGWEKCGTINILLIIDSNLSQGTLARALVTCTEAKTAALQELMIGSRFSNGIATGSGTDQTIIVANPCSELYFETAGKHDKLGELIGTTVKEAVKKALYFETDVCSDCQHSVFRRLERFGITHEELADKIKQEVPEISSNELRMQECMDNIDRNDMMVLYTSLFVHLLDEYLWNLLSFSEAYCGARELAALASAQTFNQTERVSQRTESLSTLLEIWETMLKEKLKKAL